MSTRPTIYAQASAPGRAGVSVYRISGPLAAQALGALGVERELKPREATLVTLMHSGQKIDQALALYFPAPHSFTGEEVVELHTHGSRAIAKLLLASLAAIPGLRMAEPGEFARRAFMNGKLNLVEAEGLADLIDAQTSAQHRQAMRQMSGATTASLDALRTQMLQPLALMEAYIDFPEEEIPESVLTEASERIAALVVEIKRHLNDGHLGELIREGFEMVISGPPNAGKSSLINALARRDIAIVSEEPGTTRDVLEVAMEIAGFAVTLVDTAGIRDAENTVEAEGVRRALHRVRYADFTLRLCDITTIAECSRELEAAARNGDFIIATKSDLGALPSLPFPVIAISTLTGDGIAKLEDLLKELVTDREYHASPLITRARHRVAFTEAFEALSRIQLTQPIELTCEELRLAAVAIGKITGKIWVDDVLDLVFSRFCIGK